MQNNPMKLSKYIDNLIHEHNEQAKKYKEQENDKIEFSLMSSLSNKSCQNYKLVNDYILAFNKHKESRRKLLEERKILGKVVSVLLNESFEFMNTSDLLKFCYTCVKDNYLDSTSFKSLVLATYFKIVEDELGSPSFESLHTIKSLLKVIDIIRNKNNPMYFDWKIFKGFTVVFQKNNLLYLEDKNVIEELFLTLFNYYIEVIDSMIEKCEKSHLKIVKIGSTNNPHFFDLMYTGFKPVYLQYLISNEAFICLLNEFSQQIIFIFYNMKKFSGLYLKLFSDVILTFLLLYRYKTLRPHLDIEEEKIALSLLEFINQMLNYQKTQELIQFIGYNTLYIDMLHTQYVSPKPKKQFISIRKEIELNILKINAKEIGFKKSFVYNFCNRIFTPYI